MDKEKVTKKSKTSQKKSKSSSTSKEENQKEKKNSQMCDKNEENLMTHSKATDNFTDSSKEILHFSHKKNLNGTVTLIIMPENAANKEQNSINRNDETSRPKSSMSVASSSFSLDKELAYTKLEEENGYQNLATSESTALFQTCIPYLPVEIAVVCLMFNILIPGFGSILCGIVNFCCGKMQETVKKEDIPMKVFINLLVGFMQLMTVTFLLVGWFWSIAWGIKILLLSIENQKRIKRQKILKEQKQKCKFAFNYAATDDNNDDDEIPPRLKY